jgi:hypothetical protein
MTAGEIEGYQYAVIEATNLIAVRRPDGTIRMLPGALDVESVVKSFISQDRSATGGNRDAGSGPAPKA